MYCSINFNRLKWLNLCLKLQNVSKALLDTQPAILFWLFVWWLSYVTNWIDSKWFIRSDNISHVHGFNKLNWSIIIIGSVVIDPLISHMYLTCIVFYTQQSNTFIVFDCNEIIWFEWYQVLELIMKQCWLGVVDTLNSW